MRVAVGVLWNFHYAPVHLSVRSLLSPLQFSLPPCTAPPLVTQRSPRCVFGTSTRDHLPPATLKGQYVTVEATCN